MSSSTNSGDVFAGGATTSQHVDAEDDDHFENTTFKLKRTRSLGLLDEFIQPSDADKKDSLENDKLKTEGSDTQVKNSPPEGESDEKTDSKNDSEHTEGDEKEDKSSGMEQSLLTMKSPEMLPHDDTDIQLEPSRHVDYLSHQWDVSDISKSWRYVIQKRKDVANSARLENASWRTWAQRRSNLKTISPEVVNWSKDSDVTWLYGPILKDEDNSDADDDENHKRITTATSAVAGDISIPNTKKKGPKPILKRRTVQDMMISHSNLIKLQLATNRMQDKQRQRQRQQKDIEAQNNENQLHKDNEPPEFDDYDAISAKLNSQYNNINSQNNSMVNLQHLGDTPKTTETETASNTPQSKGTLSENSNQTSDNMTIDTANNTTLPTGTDSTTNASSPIAKDKRHIHFNDEVQQCVAVDEYSDDDEYEEYEDDDYYFDDDVEEYMYENPHDEQAEYEEDDDDNDDDEGGFFLKVRSPSSASISVPGLSSGNKEGNSNNDNTEDTESVSTNNSKVYKNIQILPSTTLNYGSSDEESDEENPYTSSLSHNANNRGYDYYYDYNTVYTVDPNHSIYGSVNRDDAKAPDVVDVPKNITMGSNFDYEIIENEDFEKLPIIDPLVMNTNHVNHPNTNHDNMKIAPNESSNENKVADPSTNNQENEELPAHLLDSSAAPKEKKTPFDLEGSDDDGSDSDSDDGLSISTRNSSQSLAQQVFGNNMTPASNNKEESHYPSSLENPQPVSAHVSSINPRHSSTSVSKQSTSSNSLSQLFFSGGLTKQDEDENNELAKSFFDTSKGLATDSHDPSESSTSSQDATQLQKSLSGTQRKASPLPPHTTSANAFLGAKSPPLENQSAKKTFSFDYESESEDEFVEDITPPVDNTTPSYASLSQVADKNGIRSPSPDVTDANASHLHYNSGNASANHATQNKNIVGQAKGLANHFLGNWKSNE